MLKLAIILFFVCNVNILMAQEFIISTPKQKKNDFARNLVKLLNDAPNKFDDCKDKPLKTIDSAYPNKKVFNSKLKLPGAINGKLIIDSIPFVEYFFGNFEKKDDAESAFVNLSNQISEAMNRKVLFRNNDTGNKTTLARETKIAYTAHSGFFMYNIFVQLHRNANDSTLRLLLKIVSGKPPYYHKVMKNEPINSFMFVTALKGQLNVFQKQSWQGCLGSLLPFYCRGTRKGKDTLTVFYVKGGMQEMADAQKEFEACLTNLRVCMSDDYVYYLLPPQGNNKREVVFIKFDDIEKKRAKTIHLSLIEKSKQDYYLDLGFAY